MKVVILAGGLGTRLSEETDKIPKPMVEIGGMPILWHIMKGYAAFGYKEFVIATGYKGHTIKSFFVDFHKLRGSFSVKTKSGEITFLAKASEDWTVHCVDTGANAMTGDRVLAVRDVIGKDEDFMLTYGDGVADVDVKALVETHHTHGRLVTLTAARPKGRFGSLELDDQSPPTDVAYVNGFREKLDEGWVNAGFMVMNSRIFDASFLPGAGGVLELAMGRLAEAGHVAAYLHTGYWQTMDTLRDKHELEAAWQNNSRPWAKYWNHP